MELYLLKNFIKNPWIAKLMEEKVFTISLLLAVLSSFLVVPKISYINFKVIFCLFNLMVVICAFEDLKVMDKVALEILKKCSSLKLVTFVLLSITFFSAMLVTNDVALITFVPLTIQICKRVDHNPLKTIIFQTIAANIGSSLTPMGNPQNLFLFSYYGLKGPQFFNLMLPFVALGALCLIPLSLGVSRKSFNIKFEPVFIKNSKQAMLFGILFLVIVFSVFNVVSYSLASLITILLVLFTNKDFLKNVDFILLATFICFFIFIGNLSNIDFITNHLKYLLDSSNKTFFTSILLSQLVSNVPASILVANFTNNWREVLLGVNIGGMGTLIASMASLISYKLYINEVGLQKSSNYLLKFTIYNVLGLILFTTVNFALLKLNLI